MIELLRAAADSGPGRPAVIANDDWSITHADLLADAERFAAALVERDITRFGIASFHAATVIALLGAASLTGAEACVYPVLETPEDGIALAERFDHDVIVSTFDDLPEALNVLSPDELRATTGAAPSDPPAERPLLVLTTGTTGLPKGVRHDWARVLRSASYITPAPDQRWLLAYGLNQFGGLQILLAVMAAHATLVAPEPRRPREGLAAMRRHGVTHASGTPTFWRFVAAEMRSDGGAVPPLRQLTLGGEAVPGHLIDELQTVFPEAKISQIYGANESGNLRSVRDGRPGLPASLLDAGEDADVAVKIVDGELWVRTRIGMLGYYGDEPIDPDAWRATGDLVELDGDRIVFKGRASEIINVGGVKVHPLPIEERIGDLPGVALVRVYGRPNAMTGAIVAAEVVAEPGADTDALDDAIREACADLPAAARPRSIRFVESIETKGSKIRRGGGA